MLTLRAVPSGWPCLGEVLAGVLRLDRGRKQISLSPPHPYASLPGHISSGHVPLSVPTTLLLCLPHDYGSLSILITTFSPWPFRTRMDSCVAANACVLPLCLLFSFNSDKDPWKRPSLNSPLFPIECAKSASRTNSPKSLHHGDIMEMAWNKVIENIPFCARFIVRWSVNIGTILHQKQHFRTALVW